MRTGGTGRSALGMDGVGLARAARERLASRPVVIMSGVDRSNTALAAFLRTPRTEHVSKPTLARLRDRPVVPRLPR